MAKPHFVELKRSYTELHSELTVRAPGEQPTLCLSEFLSRLAYACVFILGFLAMSTPPSSQSDGSPRLCRICVQSAMRR